MHDCLIKTKLLPRTLTHGSGYITPDMPLAGSVMGNVAWSANTAWSTNQGYTHSSSRPTYNPWTVNSVKNGNSVNLTNTAWPAVAHPANTNWLAAGRPTGINWPIHTTRSAKTAWATPTAWPANAYRNTYAGWPSHAYYSINPGWSDCTGLTRAHSDAAQTQPAGIALASPPKNTGDNRVVCILIATLILVALDMIFLK